MKTTALSSEDAIDSAFGKIVKSSATTAATATDKTAIASGSRTSLATREHAADGNRLTFVKPVIRLRNIPRHSGSQPARLEHFGEEVRAIRLPSCAVVVPTDRLRSDGAALGRSTNGDPHAIASQSGTKSARVLRTAIRTYETGYVLTAAGSCETAGSIDRTSSQSG